MARYIDADKLIAHLKDEIKECEIPSGSRANGKSIAYGTALGLKTAISYAKTLPTADVVLREELELWKNERFNYYQRLECYEMTRQKVAVEIIDDLAKQGLLNVEPWAIDDLKKKYTEEWNEG